MRTLPTFISSLALTTLLLHTVVLADDGDLTEESLKGKNTVQVMMQNKLKTANDLFAALIAKDYNRIYRDAELLGVISKATTWHRPNDPDFMHYAVSFQNSAKAMMEQAKAKSYDGVAMNYFRLTMSCMYCHNNVRFDEKKYQDPKPIKSKK